jgi:N-acetylglucosaminyl-diphospho-decaprenol L-rhamnosyltransferase
VTELSVVLVNHNGAKCLPGALRSLAANTPTEDVECIVVDSASTDGSWEQVQQHWARARVLRFHENIGFGRGCNRGAEAADGRLVAFVNFDGEVEPGWDEPLRELLDDDGVSVATGLLLDATGETIEAAGLEIAPNMATFGRAECVPRVRAPDAPVDVTAASGALMMMRREEFLRLGGFYEPIWMYGEEADLCLRVRGRIVLHPGSAIRHGHGAAAGPPRSTTRLYWGSRNRLLNAGRHLPGPALVRAVASSAAFDALTLAQVRKRSALGAVLAGWRDGLPLLRSERRARSREEKRAAASRVISVRAALAQQRRLGRL